MKAPIEIKKDNYSEYVGLDILAFVMNPGNAPGACGEVNIVTSDGKCYHTNFINDGIDLTLILPVMGEIEEDPADNPDAVPSGWNFRHAVLGNYLFYKESVENKLEKEYLDNVSWDILEFDWDQIVRIIQDDWTARVDLMQQYLEVLTDDLNDWEDGQRKLSTEFDEMLIKALAEYSESGQLEKDREEASKQGLPCADYDVFKEGVVKKLLSNIVIKKAFK